MKLDSCRAISLIVVATISFYSGAHTASALTFKFSFDGVADSQVIPPLVGAGTFHFDGDPGNGSFALNTLSNPVFTASFGGDSFDLGDSEDPLNQVLAVIFTQGPDRFLRFGNINGNSGGQTNGAIDFFNSSNQFAKFLTFQPGILGGERYATTTNFGDYVAVAVIPEPSTLLLLTTWIGIAGHSTRRKQHHVAPRRSRSTPLTSHIVLPTPDL